MDGKGEKSYLAGEFEAMQDEVNAFFTEADEPLEEFAMGLSHKYANTVDSKTLADLMIECGLAKDVAHAQEKMQSVGVKLAAELKKLSWKKSRKSSGTVWVPPRTKAPQSTARRNRSGLFFPFYGA